MAGFSDDVIARLDLDAAKKSVLKAASQEDIPDIINSSDYGSNWDDEKTQICEQLKAGTYIPTTPYVVEVPKRSLASRPIAVLSMRDRVVFEASMQVLAPTIDGTLSDNVKSARLDRSKERHQPRPQVAAWVGFQKSGIDLASHAAVTCLLSTDITSYFEFIDLNVLFTSLRSVPGIDIDVLGVLSLILNGVSRDHSPLNGIPQGLDMSSVLGNFYLLPMDRVIQQSGLRFLRFQDDIKVFAASESSLRRLIRDLMPTVRSLHLNLSSEKTEILSGGAVREHFEDARKDAIQYGLDVNGSDALPDVETLFDEATAAQPPSDRDIRFCVTRFSKFNSRYATDWILDNLERVAFLASQLVTYLSLFSDADPSIEERVLAFLKDGERNIFPSVELHLLRYFARLPNVSDASYDWMWSCATDGNRPEFVRAWALRSIGLHMRGVINRTSDGERLRNVFRLSTSTATRRAALVALYESGKLDPAFLSQVDKSHPELSGVTKHLRNKPKLAR
jgi:Reverse transcriptase (RNA-dependent DNA polymerase)